MGHVLPYAQNLPQKVRVVRRLMNRVKAAGLSSKLNLNILITITAFSMATYHMIYTQYIILDPFLHNNVHYAFSLVLVYLMELKNKSRVYWPLLIFLIALSLVSTLYIHVNYEELVSFRGPMYALTPVDIFIGIALLVVGLEATRRAFGNIFPVIALIFIGYAYFGHYIKGPLHTPSQSINELLSMYSVGLQGGMYGTVLTVSANYIFLFVLFGGVLGATGASRFFLQMGSLAAKKLRGGPAITAVIASMLMGSVTGSSMANVATTGAFTIPLMKKVGYKPYQAGAIEAAASTGGQIMPPVMGAAAFVMAEMLELSYVRIMAAAVIPALLYFFSVAMYAQLQALKMNIVAQMRVEKIDVKRLLADAPIFIIPFFLIVTLLLLRYSPMFTIFWAIVALLVLNFAQVMIRREKLVLDQLLSGFVSGASGGARLGVTCAMLGPVVSTITVTVLGLRVPSIVALWSGGNLMAALLITMCASILLGMGSPTLVAYILVALVAAPVLVHLGVSPLSAHMFTFIFAVFSCMTPPVAVAALAACGIARSSYLRTALEAVKVGFVGFIVPYMVIFAPGLILEHISYTLTVLVVLASLIAITCFSAGLVGYALRELRIYERSFCFFITVMLLTFTVTKIQAFLFGGLAAFAVFTVWQFIRLKRSLSVPSDMNSMQ